MTVIYSNVFEIIMPVLYKSIFVDVREWDTIAFIVEYYAWSAKTLNLVSCLEVLNFAILHWKSNDNGSLLLPIFSLAIYTHTIMGSLSSKTVILCIFRTAQIGHVMAYMYWALAFEKMQWNWKLPPQETNRLQYVLALLGLVFYM